MPVTCDELRLMVATDGTDTGTTILQVANAFRFTPLTAIVLLPDVAVTDTPGHAAVVVTEPEMVIGDGIV